MGEMENKVRKLINDQYGSIPKMAQALSVPQTTIYHALDRGLDNTTTRTRKMIFDAIGIVEPSIHYAVVDLHSDELATSDERELLALYRNMDGQHRSTLMDTARAFSALSEKDGEDDARAVGAGAVDAVI